MAFTPIFGTGWEHGIATLQNNLVYGGNTIVTSNKKTGSYALQIRRGSIQFALPTPVTEIYASLWWNYNEVYSGGNSSYVGVILSDGKILKIQSSSTYFNYYIDSTLVGTGSHYITKNVWYNIKFRISIDDSSGVFHVKINGVDDLVFTGDTKPSTGTAITAVVFFCDGWNVYEQSDLTHYDDFIIGTGGWPDDLRFLALKPNGSTLTNEFIPSTSGASNYTMVDDTPMSSSDNVYTVISGAKDLYEIEDFISSAGIINYNPRYVIQWALAKKDPANSQQFKFIQKYGDAEITSSAIEISTEDLPYYFLRLINPSGTAWDDASLDNLQIGQEAII